jgi:HD-GYP domain-containing protein (c-di-GMP phosphodiesterase class II)
VEDAIAELERQRGAQFDPEMVAALRAHRSEAESILQWQ